MWLLLLLLYTTHIPVEETTGGGMGGTGGGGMDDVNCDPPLGGGNLGGVPGICDHGSGGPDSCAQKYDQHIFYKKTQQMLDHQWSEGQADEVMFCSQSTLSDRADSDEILQMGCQGQRRKWLLFRTSPDSSRSPEFCGHGNVQFTKLKCLQTWLKSANEDAVVSISSKLAHMHNAHVWILNN